MKRIAASIGLITLLLLGCPAELVQSQTPASSAVKRAPSIILPNQTDSLRFAVIGDTGTGKTAQSELAEVMAQYHAVFPFEFVLMMGDNLYGGEAG